MGMHLARREMINLLEAMRTRVARWELNGTPEIQMNTSIRAFSKLPIKITPQ
jgi:cytochrome P450